MVNRVLQFFHMSCGHRKISQPFAASAPAARNAKSEWDAVAPAGKHYVVCLDCGAKFDYDWKEMRVVR